MTLNEIITSKIVSANHFQLNITQQPLRMKLASESELRKSEKVSSGEKKQQTIAQIAAVVRALSTRESTQEKEAEYNVEMSSALIEKGK